jgi:hypothetical protein
LSKSRAFTNKKSASVGRAFFVVRQSGFFTKGFPFLSGAGKGVEDYEISRLKDFEISRLKDFEIERLKDFGSTMFHKVFHEGHDVCIYQALLAAFLARRKH